MTPITELVVTAAAAVFLSIIVTACIFAVYRLSGLQRFVMPGADEARALEARLVEVLAEGKPLTPAWGEIGAAILTRNGQNAIAVAIVFLAVFSGIHPIVDILTG